MASTSPYQQNDYQAVSTFRPYQLPVNDIAKALVAQNQYWEEGARIVKNIYNTALDLKLSKQANIDIRDQYLKEAEAKLTKLSSMDLSDPSVQREGINLFKPLLRDRGIISDDAATRHIDKIRNDANSFRMKDGGKGYSPVNFSYAMEGVEEFLNSEDREAGQAYLQKRRDYEQFYDPSSELAAIMKLCKPDKATADIPQGLYMVRRSEESLSSLKIKGCLDAGLSDKAKRQLQINGYVTYKNNPEALREKYVPYLQGLRRSLSEDKAAIEGILLNKDNLKNLKPDQLEKLGIKDVSMITPDFIKALEEKSKMIDLETSNYDQTVKKLMDGDFSPISGENFEPVASAMYSRDYYRNIGEGFSYNFQTNTKKFDDAQKFFLEQANINARQEDDQQHEADMLDKRLRADTAAKSGKSLAEILQTPGFNIDQARVQNPTNSIFSSIDTTDAYDKITEKRQEFQSQKDSLNRDLDNVLTKLYGKPSGYIPGSTEWMTWINNAEATAKTKDGNSDLEKIFLQYRQKFDPLNMLDQYYKGIQDLADEKLAPKITEMNNKVTSVKPVQTSVGVITANDMVAALSGQVSRLRVIEKPTTSTVLGGSITGATSGNVSGSTRTFILDGKTLTGQDDAQANKIYNEIIKAQNNRAVTLRKERNNILAAETVLQRETYVIPELNDKKDPNSFVNKVAMAKGIPSEKINISEIDMDGNVIINLLPADKNDPGYDPKEAVKKVLTFGAGDSQVLGADGKPDANGTTVLLRGISELDVINNNNFSNVILSSVRGLERIAQNTGDAKTGYIKSVNGREYQLSINRYAGSMLYTIIDKETKKPVKTFSERSTALKEFQDLLGNRNQK